VCVPLSLSFSLFLFVSLSLSLSHTHTHRFEFRNVGRFSTNYASGAIYQQILFPLRALSLSLSHTHTHTHTDIQTQQIQTIGTMRHELNQWGNLSKNTFRKPIKISWMLLALGVRVPSYRRRNTDFKWLRLPKFQKTFHRSPRTYETLFLGSSLHFKQVFTWVNGVPVT